MQDRQINYELGCRLPTSDWTWFNRVGIFEDESLRKYAHPFPPVELMQNVSGLTNEQDFAKHGSDIYIALSEASPKPLSAYRSILDFGCGCGRLARMFKGHPHDVQGCDIDRRHVDWINANLPPIKATLSSVLPPLPYPDNKFEAVISISIFTHLNEKSQDEFLSELHRVSAPDGCLFLTVHGERALQRAVNEQRIHDMLSMDEGLFQKAREQFAAGQHAFILQQGHLTTAQSPASKNELISVPFEYGITFIPENYIRSHWGRWFHVADYKHGGIHDFQDIVVLTPRK
jgi:SAM-dependent methyltransferase